MREELQEKSKCAKYLNALFRYAILCSHSKKFTFKCLISMNGEVYFYPRGLRSYIYSVND